MIVLHIYEHFTIIQVISAVESTMRLSSIALLVHASSSLPSCAFLSSASFGIKRTHFSIRNLSDSPRSTSQTHSVPTTSFITECDNSTVPSIAEGTDEWEDEVRLQGQSQTSFRTRNTFHCPDLPDHKAREGHQNISTETDGQIETKPVEEECAISHLPINAETTALLVVDVQPEYWSACPAIRKDFPYFEENLKRTLNVCRKHNTNVIWVRADYRHRHSPWLAQFERLNGGKRPDTMVELPYEPDSEGFGWETFATPEVGEKIIAKTSWSSTTNTALVDMLKVEGIDTVLVCGLITSVCVQHSAFGVFEAGFRTLLVEDACGDRGRDRHQAAISLYGGYMYEITTSKQLCDPDIGMQKAIPLWISLENLRSGVSLNVSGDSDGSRPVTYNVVAESPPPARINPSFPVGTGTTDNCDSLTKRLAP